MTRKEKWRSFEQAREFVRSLGLKSQSQWTEYQKLHKAELVGIPTNPHHTYKGEWKSTADWLGYEEKEDWRPFEQAREFVRSLGFKSSRQWHKYCKSGKKPVDIPASPAVIYKNQWISWPNWLGTDFKSFEEAREFVRSLHLKGSEEWKEYVKSGKKPADIPSNPQQKYKNKGWVGMGDWLGNGRIANGKKGRRPFVKAREFARSLHLKGIKEWKEYVKSGKKPVDIPVNSDRSYKNEGWISWTDFLNTNYISTAKRQYLSFEQAREFARSLHLKGIKEWKEYVKSGKLPHDIPANAEQKYKNEGWTTWGDFLNTGNIAKKNRKFLPFVEAREFVHSKGFKNVDEWEKYSASGERPDDIPAIPARVYEKEWIDWPDWFGYADSDWSIRRIKELLKGLIDSGIIYQMSEVRLYSILNSRGLLNLHQNNRHSQLFKDLIEGRNDPKKMQELKDYVNSDSEEPPVFSSSIEEEVKTAETTEELAELANGIDALEYGDIKTPEQVFKEAEQLQSICVDEEKMQFQVACSVQDLWKAAFQGENLWKAGRIYEDDTVQKIKAEGLNGNKFHDAVLKQFLTEHEQVQQIRRKLPKGYEFPDNPTRMQLYVANKVKRNPAFGNFSTTGTGKTLSAILASRVIDAKMTVIVCPNDVVEQWEQKIVQAFPDIVVITGKQAFDEKRDEKKQKYLVLNYDKFSQDYSDNEVLKLTKQKIDLLILDEVHFVKKRNDDDESQRHRRVFALRTYMRKRNKESKILVMSATPIINELSEGKSVLEMMSGNEYADLATSDRISNAVTMHEKMALVSVRERRSYAREEHNIEVKAPFNGLTKQRYAELKSNPLNIEKILTPARIPEIIKNIEGKTIIYTEYVGNGLVEELTQAVNKAGYSTAIYRGNGYEGIKDFVYHGKQVLIASKPISVGVDGLQAVCNRLIINTLPWTNAQYEQLIGRLARQGQVYEKVHVFLMKASLGPVPYDENTKWGRIQYKRTIADTAVDGISLPRKNLVTPAQAHKAAIEWLERLMRDEISTVNRREINVELTPTEIEQRIIKIGDFSKIHQRINTERSETTHERLKNNPEELIEYHRLLDEKQDLWRKTHGIVPYEVIMEKIKKFPSRMLETIKMADFGCGRAFLVKEFGKDRVYSFDHIEYENVTSCDMSHTGLSDGDIDVAVFSQSLMGVNWPDYIKEAKRCLAKNGYLFIGEATDQLENGRRLSTLLDVIRKEGFVITSEEQRAEFTFIEARKL